MRCCAQVLLLTITFSLPLHALASADGDPLFTDDSVLAVTLTAPLRALSRDRDAEPEYRPGRFSFTDIDGAVKEVDIKVRPRGKSRRKKGCLPISTAAAQLSQKAG